MNNRACDEAAPLTAKRRPSGVRTNTRPGASQLSQASETVSGQGVMDSELSDCTASLEKIEVAVVLEGGGPHPLKMAASTSQADGVFPRPNMPISYILKSHLGKRALAPDALISFHRCLRHFA